MNISVYGSSAGGTVDNQEIRNRAKEIGREIARQGHTLLTGACPGFPYDAVQGAAEHGGKCIGF